MPLPASLAAQVAAQARPISITPIRPTTLPPSSAPITLTDTFERFSTLVHQERRTAGELAVLAFRLWSANDWEALGFADCEAFCASLGISDGWWRRRVTLGDRLQHLALGEVQSLSQDVMESILRVHPSIWSEYAWVEEAKVLLYREFQMLVHQRNSQVISSQLSEPRTKLTLRVPLSQHPVLERRLESIRRQEKLGSTAEALNFALESVDRADRMSDTLSELQKQVAELSRIQELLKESQAEKEARFESGTDDSGARLKAQRLTAQILKTIGGVSEVRAEEVQTPDPRASVSQI
jgi:hypothetical protein